MWQSLPLDWEVGASRGGEQPGGVDEISAGREAVSAHLDSCDACRAEYAAERRWNDLLMRRMLDVEIPAGLEDRIKLRLAETEQQDVAVIQPISLQDRRAGQRADGSARDATISRRKLLRWGSIAATGVAAVGGSLWWLGSPWGSRGVVLTDLAAELTDANVDWTSLPEYQGTVPPLPSHKEMGIPEAVRQASPRGLKKNGEQIAAVYRFPAVVLPGQAAAEVVLLVIDLHQTRISAMPKAETFGGAEFLYYHDRAVKIWGSSSTAFCCFATATGTAYLEALLPRESIA